MFDAQILDQLIQNHIIKSSSWVPFRFRSNPKQRYAAQVQPKDIIKETNRMIETIEKQ